MNLIQDRNEEIQAKILELIADQMQGPLHFIITDMWPFYCHSYLTLISLLYIVVGEWTFSWMEPMCTAGLTWYTLKLSRLIFMKHTWWNWHAEPGTAYWNIGHTAGTLSKYGCILFWKIIEMYMCPMKYFWNILLNIFFSVQHLVSIFNSMIFCIVYYANFAYWEWVFLIGTNILQMFEMKL